MYKYICFRFHFGNIFVRILYVCLYMCVCVCGSNILTELICENLFYESIKSFYACVFTDIYMYVPLRECVCVV